MSYERGIVVISGNRFNGKDTLADALAEHLPEAARDSYAAPLKMCVHLKTGIPLRILNDPKFKEDPSWGAYGKTPRTLMQEEGEEARQRLKATVWADRLADRFQASRARVVVVSDGRHPEEEISGFKVRAPANTLVISIRVRRPSEPIAWGHPSEDKIARVPDSIFDVVVVNDGTREQLVDEAAARLADYVYLRLLTGDRTPHGWIIRCPNGARQRDAYAFKVDANVIAESGRLCVCGSAAVHAVQPAVFDGLTFPE